MLDRSLDSYLTIQPEPTPEGVLSGVQKDGMETQEHLDRSGGKQGGAEGVT